MNTSAVLACTVSILSSPSGSVLLGTSSEAVVDGIAAFTEVRVSQIGSGYRLRFICTGGLVLDSPAFTVTQEVETGAFGVRLRSGSLYVAQVAKNITPALRLEYLDVAGRVVIGTTRDVVAELYQIGNPLAIQGALMGTTVVAASAGLATFDDVRPNVTGDNFYLKFTMTLGDDTTVVIDVPIGTIGVGEPFALQITNQPVYRGAGLPFLVQPCVRVLDPIGNLITAFDGPISASVQPVSGTSDGDLTSVAIEGTRMINAKSGVASFTDLALRGDDPGQQYQLPIRLVDVDPVIDTTTSSITSTSSGPSSMELEWSSLGQYESTATLLPSPMVSFRNLQGNFVALTPSTPLQISAVSLEGNHAEEDLFEQPLTEFDVTPVIRNGVAFFQGLRLSRAGKYRLLVQCCSGLQALSSSFDVTIGTAKKLITVVQPHPSTIIGIELWPFPAVIAVDQGENWATEWQEVVSVGVQWEGWQGGTPLNGARSTTMVYGVAAFDGLSISAAATGARLVFTSADLIPAISDAFNVTGPPVTMRLEWPVTAMSPMAQAGLAFAIQPITILQDIHGVDIGCACTNGLVSTVAHRADDPTPIQAFGHSRVAVQDGRALFTDLQVQAAGTGFRISFTFEAQGTGYPISVISNLFTVRAALPVELKILRDMDAHL